jgi:hypothetical protein
MRRSCSVVDREWRSLQRIYILQQFDLGAKGGGEVHKCKVGFWI